MSILEGVKEEFFYTTFNIDNLISKYLIKRLGVNDIKTINALGLKGKKAFNKRLHLLMQIKSISPHKKKKLDIYAKLYQALMLKKDMLVASEDDFTFLTENYPQKDSLDTSKKVGKILTDFVLDVQYTIEMMSKIPTIKVVNEKNNSVEKVVALTAL